MDDPGEFSLACPPATEPSFEYLETHPTYLRNHSKEGGGDTPRGRVRGCLNVWSQSSGDAAFRSAELAERGEPGADRENVSQVKGFVLNRPGERSG